MASNLTTRKKEEKLQYGINEFWYSVELPLLWFCPLEVVVKFSPTLYDSIIVGKFLSINPVFVVFYSDARQNVFFSKDTRKSKIRLLSLI